MVGEISDIVITCKKYGPNVPIKPYGDIPGRSIHEPEGYNKISYYSLTYMINHAKSERRITRVELLPDQTLDNAFREMILYELENALNNDYYHKLDRNTIVRDNSGFDGENGILEYFFNEKEYFLGDLMNKLNKYLNGKRQSVSMTKKHLGIKLWDTGQPEIAVSTKLN